MTDENFTNLSAKVDELINLCAEMKKENQLLRETQSAWDSERKELIAKNQAAKTRLQSILERLRAMDNN